MIQQILLMMMVVLVGRQARSLPVEAATPESNLTTPARWTPIDQALPSSLAIRSTQPIAKYEHALFEAFGTAAAAAA